MMEKSVLNPPQVLEKHEIVYIPPRALVVGATGYVGNALVQDLVAREIETIAHIRRESRLFERGCKHFEAIGAELDHSPWSRSAWTTTLRTLRPTVIFACLGTTKKRRKRASKSDQDKETYREVDYGLTKMLIDCAVESGIKPKFIYLSARGASTKSPSTYLRVRGELEAYLCDSGLEYVIARPTLISGKDRAEKRPLELFTAKVSDRVFGFIDKVLPSSLNSRFGSFTALELADALVAAAFDSDYSGKVISSQELREISQLNEHD